MPLERTSGSAQAPSIDSFHPAAISLAWNLVREKSLSRFYHSNPILTWRLTLRLNRESS